MYIQLFYLFILNNINKKEINHFYNYLSVEEFSTEVLAGVTGNLRNKIL